MHNHIGNSNTKKFFRLVLLNSSIFNLIRTCSVVFIFCDANTFVARNSNEEKCIRPGLFNLFLSGAPLEDMLSILCTLVIELNYLDTHIKPYVLFLCHKS